MNGVSERTIRTLKEMARTMLAGAKLQDREEFWGEAVATATYTRNLSPSHAFNGQVPLIGLYPNLTPRYDWFRIARYTMESGLVITLFGRHIAKALSRLDRTLGSC
jgi:hypothetical protein